MKPNVCLKSSKKGRETFKTFVFIRESYTMKEHNQHYTSGFEACGFYINKTFIHSLTPNALNTSNLVHWISFFRNLTIIFRASIRYYNICTLYRIQHQHQYLSFFVLRKDYFPFIRIFRWMLTCERK